MANRPGQGRTPQPLALRALKGNPDGGRMPEDLSAGVRPGSLVPPEHLENPIARQEWLNKAPLLVERGLLTELDEQAFAAYCQSWAVCVACMGVMEKMRQNSPLFEGLVVRTTKGQLVENPVIKTYLRTMDTMLRVSIDLGLTPIGRAKVALARQTKGNSKEAGLRGEFLAS